MENSYASDTLFNTGIHAELKGLILDKWNNWQWPDYVCQCSSSMYYSGLMGHVSKIIICFQLVLPIVYLHSKLRVEVL